MPTLDTLESESSSLIVYLGHRGSSNLEMLPSSQTNQNPARLRVTRFQLLITRNKLNHQSAHYYKPPRPRINQCERLHTSQFALCLGEIGFTCFPFA